MKQATQNTFNNGLQMDLNPLTTPKDVLTDAVNATIITYNGNEFVLQNDMGNCKVERAKLTPGFIPLGMKEYGGIIYVVSYNPITDEGEIGSFPSPERDFSTTDFDELQPVKFKTNQFVLETNTTTEKSTKHVGKLFEPELFQLHPGDMYVITYLINSVAGPSPINNVTAMNQWISKDPANRKLFRLKFYKITDSNNLVDLDAADMKVIPSATDIEDEYVYFKEDSNATIAVGLEIEGLDMFDVNVVDNSRKTDSNKRVIIEAIGQSASLNDFQGVKVKITSPEVREFFVTKPVGTKKISTLIDDLDENAEFECEVTPFSSYCLFPKLSKKFKFTLGKYLSGGTGVNDIFRYYLDPTGYLKMEFDYKFEGNSPEGAHLYVEFYDPWSDYSVVKRVDSPTYYGFNTVTIDLIDEPRTTVFDTITTGGTPTSKLGVNPDTQYEKTLLNSTNLIRKDQYLRKNHFYIVRVSGVDKIIDPDTGVVTYTHYDFYKGLYTNDMFNDVYTTQLTLSPSDPTYIKDFNSLLFDISTIKYKTDLTTSYAPVTRAPILQNYPQATEDVDGIPTTVYPLMTGTNYYKVRSTPYTGDTRYKTVKTFQTDAEYNVQLTLQGIERVFGSFKSELLSVEFPTLVASDSTDPGSKPIITEPSVPGEPDTKTKADWVTNSISDLLYKVNVKLTTLRSTEATATFINKTGREYSTLSLSNTFHYFPNGDGPLSNPYATIEISRDPSWVKWVDSSGVVHQIDYDKDDAADDEDLYALNFGKNYSGFWMCCYNRETAWWFDGAPGDYGQIFSGDPAAYGHRHGMLALRNPYSARISGTRTHSIAAAKDLFDTLKVANNVTKDLRLYYPDPNTITENRQLKSTASFKDAPIVTNFSPEQVGGVNVKTYISDFYFRALGGEREFNPTVLNAYIASRQGDSTILDGKNVITDGFIPYISAAITTSYMLQFPDITIDQAADSSTTNAYAKAATIGAQDAAFTADQNARPHGTLFTSDSTKYANYIGKFGVEEVYPNTSINPATLHIFLSHGDEPLWRGYHGRGGKDKVCDAPDLLQDFQIS